MDIATGEKRHHMNYFYVTISGSIMYVLLTNSGL